MAIKNIIAELEAVASEEKAKILSRFFKTGKGEYGEGDIFLGVTVPQVRAVACAHAALPYSETEELLMSPVHEHRLCGFLILVEQFRRARPDEDLRWEIKEYYLAHGHRANNWDLVDLSAPKILGEWLADNPDSKLLDKLSRSDNLWIQRIAIVCTLALIRRNRHDDTLRLAQRFLEHTHPLIHKATGWMLREVGKRDESALIDFLDRHYTMMPRTALRYAIERLTPEQKAHYMAKKQNGSCRRNTK